MENIWIASFDIGKKNFSFYIEKINILHFKTIKNINKKNRYNADGTCTDDFTNILTDIYKNGEKVLLENIDLTYNCDKKVYLDPETMFNMYDILDNFSKYWDKCSIFLIEKQMSFGKNNNTMAIKLGQHCWSYFCFKYGRFKTIIEYPAYNKTQILGAHKKQYKYNGKLRYKSISKPERKKWCIHKAIEILNTRNDLETISIIDSCKKKDDLCDVICQLQSFKYLNFVDV